jgi:GGDEF domain-containing protein
VAAVHFIDSHDIFVTTSIGVSIYPYDGPLIRNADIAMYHAKKNGSQNYRFFRPEMTLEDEDLRSNGQDLWHRLDWYELKSGSSIANPPGTK